MTSGVPGHDGKDPPTLAGEIAPAVATLAGEGHGRNAISRALGVSTGTVSNAARIAGVEFDVAGTEVASRTRAEQLAEDRAALAEQAAEIGRRAGRRLFMELGAELLDPAAIGALNKAWGTAADKLILASATVPDDNADEYRMARLWLDGLHAQIRASELGILPADDDGNYPMRMGQPGAHLDHDNPDELEDQ